ncbi:MAG: hypothetical protein IJZ16_06835 [Clostridia bacterium]|nr:hypothetical protein [Clostridia bacterium]
MISVSPTELHSLLKERNINCLYFSCSVRNACSMINTDSFLSLRQLAYKELPMSDVTNAAIYKQASLWNKRQFHLCNLHEYFPRQNKLGPVCFRVSIDFLLDVHPRDLYITKRNPLHWRKGLHPTDICYSSVQEFSEVFEALFDKRLLHKNIILVRDKRSEIKLSDYLLEIILDKPGDKFLLWRKSTNALKESLNNEKFSKITFKTSPCKKQCHCAENYNDMASTELENLFRP